MTGRESVKRVGDIDVVGTDADHLMLIFHFPRKGLDIPRQVKELFVIHRRDGDGQRAM